MPTDATSASVNMDWSEYRVSCHKNVCTYGFGVLSRLRMNFSLCLQMWDLVRLTQNYLKLLLAHIKNGNEGLLIHCISGWDRTPLFVSLIRLSLWADGVVHKSLNAEQVLLTVMWIISGSRVGILMMYF